VSLTAAVLRLARGRLRYEQGLVSEGLEDFLAVGARLSGGLVTCPGFLPWRSSAALAHLAPGNLEAAEHLSQEELVLARVRWAPGGSSLGCTRRAIAS
jgi:hypothetical protein